MPAVATHHHAGCTGLEVFKDPSIRMGIFVGLLLSTVFSTWLLIANRAPLLEPLALERNIGGAALLAFLAALPVLRFFRSPADLLCSGLLAWSLLTFSYRVCCFKFIMLEQYCTALHVFALGAICYLVFATISWIGTIIWRVHATDDSHTRH
jgi:hypothetical protein